MKKVNFKELNVKPFIGPNVTYQSGLFIAKFKNSLAKLLILKGLKWDIIHEESNVLKGSSLDSIPPSWAIIPFSYGEHTNLGYILLSSSLVSELVHKLLGGSDDVLPLDNEKELTTIEQKSLESLNSVWSLTLRESLTPFLHLNDGVIHQYVDHLNFDLGQDNYFYEKFKIVGLLTGEIHTFMKVDPFKKK